jgi:hypothetical protein
MLQYRRHVIILDYTLYTTLHTFTNSLFLPVEQASCGFLGGHALFCLQLGLFGDSFGLHSVTRGDLGVYVYVCVFECVRVRAYICVFVWIGEHHRHMHNHTQAD